MSVSRGSVFSDWQDKNTQLYSNAPMVAEHNLHQSPLFSDDALAELLDNCPREYYQINTMDPNGHNPRSWREGEIGSKSGKQVLEAVRNGRIWVNILKVARLDPRYKDVLHHMYSDLEENNPGLETFKQNLTILISSPKIQVFYHCDIPGQSLWQIRGRKKVWVYPATQPFLSPQYMEKIVLGESEEEGMPYETWFDDYAEILNIEPGQMVTWPLNAPHRVVNEDCVNVSLATEHWTNKLRGSYATHYANGLIRRWTGAKDLAQQSSGLMYMAKMGLAAGVKISGIQKKRAVVRTVDFEVDPQAPDGFRDIAAHSLG